MNRQNEARMKTDQFIQNEREEMNTDQGIPEQTAETQSLNSPQRRRGRFWTALMAVFAAAILLGFFIMSGIRSRMEAQTSLKEATQKSAVLAVKVVHPKKEAPV